MDLIQLTKDIQGAVDSVIKLRKDVADAEAKLALAQAGHADAVLKAQTLHQQYLAHISSVLPALTVGGKHTTV